MGRPIGSGTGKTVYISFRTSQARYDAMMKLGKKLGFSKNVKSKVYRTAERLLIRQHRSKGEDE